MKETNKIEQTYHSNRSQPSSERLQAVETVFGKPAQYITVCVQPATCITIAGAEGPRTSISKDS
eukprot:1844348-Amphidinium_carterae.1